MVDNKHEVEQPWMRAQSGTVWRKSQNLPNDINTQLKMENGFTKTIGDYLFHVKRNEDEGLQTYQVITCTHLQEDQ